MQESTDILIGKTLTGVQIAKDRQAIKFETTDGDIVARCDADCCSYTWIEHVELPALGFPATILSREDIPLPEETQGDKTSAGKHGGEYVDYVQFYGFKLVTDRGEFIIDYRNDSNGYYGGWLCFPDKDYYGGVHGQNVSEEEWENA